MVIDVMNKRDEKSLCQKTLTLGQLRNVGPAALGDFALLGIESVAQLAACEPDPLYQQLQIRTGQRQDPCVWDVFAATIHQAKTGEALNWWAFTAERKARFSAAQSVVSQTHPR